LEFYQLSVVTISKTPLNPIRREISIMANIKFVHGEEFHTGTYRKFYVKGLEKWQVEDSSIEIKKKPSWNEKDDEEFFPRDERNDYYYNGYCCNAIPERTLFTIFTRYGDYQGQGAKVADDIEFFICCTDDQIELNWNDTFSPCFCQGNFKIVAKAVSKTKALQLMTWWIYSPDNSLAFAEHCALHIDKKGMRQVPPINK